MKKITILFIFLTQLVGCLFSQQKKSNTVSGIDSLSGFDARYFLAINLPVQKQDVNYKAMLANAKRNYIIKKYNLHPTPAISVNTNNNLLPSSSPINIVKISTNPSTVSKNTNSNNSVYVAEICNNGIDDDLDGFIDINDPDCACSGFSSSNPVPSMIPNANFEAMNCCPTGYSQVNCAQGWIQATDATSDYFNCGYNFGAATAAGISPLPPANGNGYLGCIFSPGWQEYVGSCLISPMLAGTQYQLSLSIAASYIDGQGNFCQAGAPPPINITLFGNTSCANLPASGTGCPGGSWAPIGSVLYNPANAWGTITMTFTPTSNINSIILGSPCTLPAGYNGACYPYFYFDNLILNTTTMFNTTTIAQTGGICTNNLVLTAAATTTLSGGTWQWYKNGIAIVGQTSNTLNISALSLGSGTYSVKFTIGANCEIVNKIIAPPIMPVVNFSVSSACFGTSMTFTNASTTATGTNTYAWNFGNGSPTVAATSPNYTYPTAGNYTVTLIATNTDGCKDSLKKSVSAFPLPLSNFNLNYIPCGSTSFTATSTSSLNGGSPITNYVYNWNDASPNSLVNPAPHTYATSGPKTIKLVITNANGCKDSVTKNITITQKPTANFTVSSACSGAITNFTNNSTTPSGTNSYTWNFGNGSAFNNSTNPSYSYPTSGNFSVTLITVNTDGCIDSIVKPLSIFGRAVVNFGPTSVCFNTATSFTNLTSTSVNPNTAAVSSWSWNFGTTPASSSIIQNPVYTYTNPANGTTNTTYSATLFATTANGCKDSLTKPVTVYSLPTTNFLSDSVCWNNLTTLTDDSNGNGNPFFLFSWDFNQDAIADVSNNSSSTSTVFPNYGNTSVTYTVFTNPISTLHCSSVITKMVWVHPLPVASITNTNTCIDTQPSNISGVNSTIPIGSIANYAWDFGNGNTNLTNPTAPTSFSYNVAGNYVVTLTVTSNAGCSTTDTNTIEVWERPYGNFSYSKACFGKRTTVKGLQLPGSGTIASYDWDFNNTPPSIEASGAQVNYTFAAAGFQTVNMFLTTNKGCKNSKTANIYINYNPKPNFYAPKHAGCADFCLKILDSSLAVTGPAKNNSWAWDFGNGSHFSSTDGNLNTICFSNESNTVVKNYTVKLVLRTDSGCVDSLTRGNYISVYPNPKADFEWKGETGDILTPKVEFTNTSIGYSAFAWYYNDGVNVTDSTKINPIHYFDTDLPRNFNVFLAVRNQYGCKDTTNKLIDIGPEYTFYIPNAFTPNGDGENDIFVGKGIGIKTYNMWIFDRWGEKIFQTSDIKNGWDGTVKGKQVEGKMDVYQWKVIVSDLNNKQHEYVGHVTLIK